jgi:hypothetical protein
MASTTSEDSSSLGSPHSGTPSLSGSCSPMRADSPTGDATVQPLTEEQQTHTGNQQRQASVGVPSTSDPQSHICIVGSGISGLSAAFALQRAGYRVTIFEKDQHVGGHAWTQMAGDIPVDTGFMVLNAGQSEEFTDAPFAVWNSSARSNLTDDVAAC